MWLGWPHWMEINHRMSLIWQNAGLKKGLTALLKKIRASIKLTEKSSPERFFGHFKAVFFIPARVFLFEFQGS